LRGLLLRNLQDGSGVNSAHSSGVYLEFRLPSHPNRRPERNLLGNLEDYLRDNPRDNLQGDLPSSLHGRLRGNLQGELPSFTRGRGLGIELVRELRRSHEWRAEDAEMSRSFPKWVACPRLTRS